jgi:hypothetical protein
MPCPLPQHFLAPLPPPTPANIQRARHSPYSGVSGTGMLCCALPPLLLRPPLGRTASPVHRELPVATAVGLMQVAPDA